MQGTSNPWLYFNFSWTFYDKIKKLLYSYDFPGHWRWTETMSLNIWECLKICKGQTYNRSEQPNGFDVLHQKSHNQVHDSGQHKVVVNLAVAARLLVYSHHDEGSVARALMPMPKRFQRKAKLVVINFSWNVSLEKRMECCH